MTDPRFRRALVALGLTTLAACNDSTGNAGNGTLTLRITDAPIGNVESAKIWVSRSYLIGGSDENGGQITISNEKAEYELLSLQNGVTAALGSASIPVGTYSQLRLVVDSAKVTLVDGITFSDGSSTRVLKVPSGSQSGLKVNFAPVQITAGETVLVADFDVSRSFVFQGPRNAPNSVSFKPVIHATVQNVAASIAGTVTPAASESNVYAVSKVDGDTVATAIADKVTGAYKLWFLPPGAYEVSAKATAVGSTFTASKDVTVAASENATGVNLP
ncbi:MAG TPA: DUF4382 domain-containing protein [Gemmatimonadaceae bacterium]|nr:DUF4382 domain-containing protein [Gemmatimonadaceae bacterium]